MASTHNTTKIDNTCCYWIKHSETCANIKTATVSIVAAVALAAVAIGVLFVLAQQGINLGGINELANLIEAKWLYMGLGFATAAVVVDAIVIIAMVRSYLNRAFSDEELKKHGVLQNIKDQHIAKKMGPKTYWKVTQEAEKATDLQQGKPAIYTVVVKDENNKHTKSVGFKVEEECNAYINKLKSDYQDGEKIFTDAAAYPETYIEATFDKDVFKEMQKLGEGLQDGYYRKKQWDNPFIVEVVATSNDKKIHYFKEDKADSELRENYKELRNIADAKIEIEYTQEEAKAQMGDAAYAQTTKKLAKFLYWKGDIKSTDGTITFHVVFFGNETQPHFFKTEADRETAIKNSRCINSDTVEENIIETTEKQKFDERATQDNVYCVDDYTIENQKVSVLIYKSGGYNSYVVFANPEERAEYLKTPAANALIHMDIAAGMYKNEDAATLISAEHLKIVKDAENELKAHPRFELITYDIPTKDNTKLIYALINSEITELNEASGIKRQFSSKVSYFTAHEARAAFIKAKLDPKTYKDINAFNHASNGPPQGMSGGPGVKAKFHLEEMLLEEGESFTFDFKDAFDQQFFGWVTLTDMGLEADYKTNPDDRKKAIGTDCTSYITGFDHAALEAKKNQLQKAQDLDKTLRDLNSWLAQGMDVAGKKMDFLFYKGVYNMRTRISESGRESAQKAKKGFSFAAAMYKNEDAATLISAEHLKIVRDAENELKAHQRLELITYDIPTKDNTKVIYALINSEITELNEASGIKRQFTSKVSYFSTHEARAAFIKAKLDPKTYKDIDAFNHASNGPPQGMSGGPGVKAKFHLEEMLLEEEQSFTFDFKDAFDQQFFGWVTLTDTGLEADYKTNPDDRKKAIGTDCTNYISGFDHAALEAKKDQLQKDKHLDKILIKNKDSWLEQKIDVAGKKMDFLFYKGILQIRTCISESEKGSAQKAMEDFTLNDTKKAFNESPEYPQPLGEFLTKQAGINSKGMISCLLSKEFSEVPLQKTKVAEYPEIAPFFARFDEKNIAHYYFKKESDLKDTIDQLKKKEYISSSDRHKAHEAYAIEVAEAINTGVDPKKPCYMKLEHSESNKSHLVIATFDGGKWQAKSQYDSIETIRKKTRELKDYNDEQECYRVEYKKVYSEWNAPGKLGADTFAVVPLCNGLYTLIFIHGSDGKLLPSIYRKIDKIGLNKHIENLKKTRKQAT